MPSELRSCNNCGSKFPRTPDHWHRNRTRPDGLEYACKACVRARAKKWQTDNPDKVKAKGAKWYREHENLTKQRSRDWYQNNKKRALDNCKLWAARNRSKVLAAKRKWRMNNAAKQRQLIKQWRKRNPEKIRQSYHRRRAWKRNAPGSWSAEDLRRLLKLQKGKCWWCGTRLRKDHHIDHRIPLAKGGTNYLSNLVLTCPHCNLSKQDKLPSEFTGRLL